MTDQTELAEAEATYLEALAEQLRRRAQEIREVTREDRTPKLVGVLEGLPFKPAKSGKCDWIAHDQVPAEVFSLFDAKGDFKTGPFHYRRMPDGNVLRFSRGGPA